MNIGKLFGSISPVFGLASGQGLFGSKAMAPLFGMAGMAAGGHGLGGILQQLFGGGGSEGPMQPDIPKPDLSAPAPLSSGFNQPLAVPRMNVGQAVSSIPPIAAKPDIGQQLGAALQSSVQGAPGDWRSGLSATGGPMFGHGGLQAILSSLGIM